MMNSIDNDPTSEGGRKMSPYPQIIVVLAVIALGCTYFAFSLGLSGLEKAYVFAGIIVSYLIACFALYRRLPKRRRLSDSLINTSDANIEGNLSAIDEAALFFAGSLRPTDAFRLACSKMRDIVPFELAILYLLDGTRTSLVMAGLERTGTADLKDKAQNIDNDLAEQCFSTRRLQIDRYLSLDSTQEFGSTVAIPLCRDSEVFGVVQIFFDSNFNPDKINESLYEALGFRIAPLMLSSIAFELSQTNAMTDITTDLPNERAFYLALESQVAETHRRESSKPLTVLAIDIKNFGEINQKFGHKAGDLVLNFVAQVVKDNLRQMDFFARSLNDEFLGILPTADREISNEIIARIHTDFQTRKLDITESESIEIELNIGWASFGSDGETPAQLLSLAQLRKEQIKSIDPQKVLWFPQKSAK